MKIINKVKKLQNKKQPAQKSKEWYSLRNTCITASEASSCLHLSEEICKTYLDEFPTSKLKFNENKNLSPFDTLESYIINKCDSYFNIGKGFVSNKYTEWGNKYEPIAVQLYMKEKNTNVLEFGFLQHSRLKWLGASPDGITNDGIMLEIKCPYSRKLSSYPPIYYWVQCQIQMEVCNLDECDFLECNIKEISLTEFNNLENIQYYGIIIENDLTNEKIIEETNEKVDNEIIEEMNQEIIEETNEKVNNEIIEEINEKVNNEIIEETNEKVNNEIIEETNTCKFLYPPLECKTKQDYINWSNTKKGKKIYFKVDKFQIIKINRKKEWFNVVKSKLKNTYDLLQKYFKNKNDFLNYKESCKVLNNKKYLDKITNTECLIDDVSSFEFDLSD